MDSAPTALLSGFPIVITLPVLWGDQDAFGHVNNTVYFRWFESARIAYFGRSGFSEMLAAERVGPVLAAITCNFRQQVHYPDTVRVGAKITRIGRSSLTMDHLAVLESSGTVAADGTSTLVVIDYTTNRSSPVPDAIRRTIGEIEGASF